MRGFLDNVVHDSVTCPEHAQRKTGTATDLIYALKRQGGTRHSFEALQRVSVPGEGRRPGRDHPEREARPVCARLPQAEPDDSAPDQKLGRYMKRLVGDPSVSERSFSLSVQQKAVRGILFGSGDLLGRPVITASPPACQHGTPFDALGLRGLGSSGAQRGPARSSGSSADLACHITWHALTVPITVRKRVPCAS